MNDKRETPRTAAAAIQKRIDHYRKTQHLDPFTRAIQLNEAQGCLADINTVQSATGETCEKCGSRRDVIARCPHKDIYQCPFAWSA